MDIFSLRNTQSSSNVDYADRAEYLRFWNRDLSAPHIVNTVNGGSRNGLVDDSQTKPTFWQMAQQLNNIYISWKISRFEPLRKRIADQWAYIQNAYTPQQLAGDGTDGTVIISDDAVWKACVFMQVHEATGDQKALNYLSEMIAATTTRFRDPNHSVFTYGNTPGIPGVAASRSFVSGQYGMLYAATNDASSTSQYGVISTSYEAGFGACAAYVWEQTGYDYLNYAKNTFNWTKAKLRTPAPADSSRKAQALYETELVLNPGGDTKSSSAYETPRNAFYGKPIRGLDSTYIGGALGMGVLAARLFKLTGATSYRDEVNAIAAAIPSLQGYGRDVNGVRLIQNTRDPWTDGFWAPLFVAEGLSISGTDTGNTLRNAFVNTANYIHSQALSSGTYPNYAGDWAGPENNFSDNTNTWLDHYSKNPGDQASPQQMMTTSSTISMIQAGWIAAQQLGI